MSGTVVTQLPDAGTAQVHQGDVLVIDRNPADKALAFLRDPEGRAPDPSIFLGPVLQVIHRKFGRT